MRASSSEGSKGFRNVIVGTSGEAVRHVFLVRAGREENHVEQLEARGSAQPAEDLEYLETTSSESSRASSGASFPLSVSKAFGGVTVSNGDYVETEAAPVLSRSLRVTASSSATRILICGLWPGDQLVAEPGSTGEAKSYATMGCR